MHMTAEDHARVTAAVGAAEARTDGEIVTIVAARSDDYHDVALHWSVLAMLLVPAAVAFAPDRAAGLLDRAGGWDDRWSAGALMTALLLAQAAAFLLVRLLLSLTPVRMALTPGATKSRRVQRRALKLFRASAEHRTQAATGVMIYLSLDEHRAELIADAGIHARVDEEHWGEAMAALVAASRDGRPADGMADAVAIVGDLLAEHFPRGACDRNELPDRLIEL